MRVYWYAAALAALVLVAPRPAVAQQPDTRADTLRQLIQERFARAVQEQLGLTGDQASRLRETTTTWFARRRNLELEERDLKRALAGQLRPGIAADQDSVDHLLNRLLDVKVRQVETYRDEMKDLGFLTPVQRAQFFAMRERLMERVQDIQDRAQQRQPLRGARRPLRQQPRR